MNRNASFIFCLAIECDEVTATDPGWKTIDFQKDSVNVPEEFGSSRIGRGGAIHVGLSPPPLGHATSVRRGPPSRAPASAVRRATHFRCDGRRDFRAPRVPAAARVSVTAGKRADVVAAPESRPHRLRADNHTLGIRSSVETASVTHTSSTVHGTCEPGAQGLRAETDDRPCPPVVFPTVR